VPPAPGRFSTTKVCPTCLPTCSKTTRATISLATPAGTGTITVTLREGQSCAGAGVSAAMSKNALNMARQSMVFIDVSSGERYDVEAKTKAEPLAADVVISSGRSACPETPGAPLQLSLKPLFRYKLKRAYTFKWEAMTGYQIARLAALF